MKPGLRLQILLLLGALLVLGFVPLYFAVERYLTVALTRSESEGTLALGRAVASHVVEALEMRSEAAAISAMQTQLGKSGVEAIQLYDARGEPSLSVGAEPARHALPRRSNDAPRGVKETSFAGRRSSIVLVAERSVQLSLLVTHNDPAAQLLARLLGLYMALLGVLLLAAAYFTLTRWIVTPIGELSRAAQRLATTTRRWEPPLTRSRELSELSTSLERMTAKLLAEENALRHKVSEVEQATSQLERAQTHLVRSERLASVGQLAAGLAHEVGNPIAAMMGLQDLILTGDLSAEEQLDFVKRMRKETERIHRILRDLLAFARPGAAPRENSDGGSLEAAIHETTTLLLPQPALRDVEIKLDIYPELPLVRLGQAELTQVLFNLLLNAASACKQGGSVLVRAHSKEGGVMLVVEDNGSGVPAELRDRIFEPFFSSKDVGEGSGLGLSVCRGLVESVGGSITLDEEYQPGARFVVFLPATS